MTFSVLTLTLLASIAVQQSPSWCEAIVEKANVDGFQTLRECLLHGRPLDSASASELFKRALFSLDRGYWKRTDPGGHLSVRAVIEGRGVTAYITFTPRSPESIAPGILQHLLATATEVSPASPATALAIRHRIESPGFYENCNSTDERTVAISGMLLEQRFILLCTK